MRIAAVCCSDENELGVFGIDLRFRLYDTAGDSVSGVLDIHAEASGMRETAEFLSRCRASILLCSEVGAGGQKALLEKGIVLYTGASGNADEAVKALLSGELDYDPTARPAGACVSGCAHCKDNDACPDAEQTAGA